MGALISQAIANQLRQVPGFQNPNPSPSTLLQQVLNPPGPSRPMWMAPVMENRQLLATNTPEAQQAMARDALRAVMSFGGADITKEQRLAWEKENEEWRELQRKHAPDLLEPGTRVEFRPYVYREDIGKPTRGGLGRFGSGVDPTTGPPPFGTGTVVDPKSPDAGTRGGHPDPPGPDYVAVRGGGSWYWRHRDSLEILPPKELRPGVRVLDGGFPGEKPEEAIVVDHNDPKEKPGFIGRKRLQPSPEHVAIRKPGSKEYYWRHPSELEILPPDYKKKK